MYRLVYPYLNVIGGHSLTMYRTIPQGVCRAIYYIIPTYYLQHSFHQEASYFQQGYLDPTLSADPCGHSANELSLNHAEEWVPSAYCHAQYVFVHLLHDDCAITKMALAHPHTDLNICSNA